MLKLSDLIDVDATAPSDNDVLTWDNATNQWVPSAATAAAMALSGLSDVDATAPSDNDVLTWDSATNSWGPAAASTIVGDLSDLGDVEATTPADGDVLTWDDATGKWINAASAVSTIVLSDITDVDPGTPADRDVLTYDESENKWFAAPWASDAATFYNVRNYASFAAAITAIGTTEATLLIPEDQSVTAGAAITVPVTMTLFFINGKHIDVATGATLAINGKVLAPPRQIFHCTGTGVVSFSSRSVEYVLPQWWGATADGTTDDTTAVQAACTTGVPVKAVGTYVISTVTASDQTLIGTGTFKHKSAEKSVMFELTGDNSISDVTIDYDWTNALLTLPYTNNFSVRQTSGSLVLRNVTFINSQRGAVRITSGSAIISDCRFTGGCPHNNLDGGDERPTSYVYVSGDAAMDTGEYITVTGCCFEGPETDPENYCLNPGGIFMTASALSGTKYKTVNITGNTFIYCGQNAGAGNYEGAIDTYNGVENIVISGNIIRFHSYAGIKVQNSSWATIVGNEISGGYSSASAYDDHSYAIMLTEKIRSDPDEQYGGVISGNTIKDSTYIAIWNSLDNVSISDNIIDGVTKSTWGYGIYDSGNNVSIVGNTMIGVEGGCILSGGGGNKTISNNACAQADASTDIICTFSGENIVVSGNIFSNGTGTANSGIRTNGPSNNVSIRGNILSGCGYGVYVGTTGGAVDTVDVDGNTCDTIGTQNIYVSGAVSNYKNYLQKTAVEATASIEADSSTTITLNIPSGARIIGAQLRVETALTGGELWDAAYSGGSTVAIVSGAAVAKNTKVTSMFNTFAATDVTTNTTNIAITKNGGGSFTAAGSIRATVQYETMMALNSI